MLIKLHSFVVNLKTLIDYPNLSDRSAFFPTLILKTQSTDSSAQQAS